jgi:hypothetical protein
VQQSNPAALAVYQDSSATFKITHLPTMIEEFQLAMSAGDVWKHQHDIAVLTAANHELSLPERDGITVTGIDRDQLAEHLDTFPL